jgi:hypothetical protein
MAPNRQPSPEDRAEAIVIALSGVASGEESGNILSKLAAQHNRNNTFPTEELLVNDAGWWEADDLWTYSFFAFLIYVRAAAERTDRPSEAIARSIADRRGVTLARTDS